MDVERIYTHEDCVCKNPDLSIHGKVVVLEITTLPDWCKSQLFYCTGEAGEDAICLVSLFNGEFHWGNCSDVVGILKPELLPDSAKLQLSQIRPEKALSLNEHEPKYSGYSFLPDDRHASGVWLCNESEAMDYIAMQKPYQHRIMICDRNDFCVMEMKNQELIHPTPEELAVFAEHDNWPGMEMT